MVNLPVDEKIAERLHALAAQKQTDISTLLEGLLDTVNVEQEFDLETPEGRTAALDRFIGAIPMHSDLSSTVSVR